MLVVTAQPDMLKRLQVINTLLKEIRDGLNTDMDEKRRYFPRLGPLGVAMIVNYDYRNKKESEHLY